MADMKKYYGIISFATVNILIAILGLWWGFRRDYFWEIIFVVPLYLLGQPVMIASSIYFNRKACNLKTLNYFFIAMHIIVYMAFISWIIYIISQRPGFSLM